MKGKKAGEGLVAGDEELSQTQWAGKDIYIDDIVFIYPTPATGGL